MALKVLDDISQLVDISGSVLGSEIGTRIEVLATDDVRLVTYDS